MKTAQKVRTLHDNLYFVKIEKTASSPAVRN